MENNKFRENYLVCNPQESEFKGNNIGLNNLPLVSFCIPTKNNEDTLDNCLRSIKQQNYPKIEIIIVDGYSKDHTVPIAKRYTNKIFFCDKNLGISRQKSIDLAAGEILALFDSDIIIPHENWLRNAIKFFNYSNSVSSIWPLYQASPNASKFSRLYQTNLYPLIIFNRIKNNRGYFGGGNTLFLRKYIDEIGGINQELHWGEDFDWAKKLKKKGYQVVLIKDPLYHDTMKSLKEFTKKQLTGADTFIDTGFGLMGLTLSQILYENYILGTRGMIYGIIKEKDPSWMLYPFIPLIRTFAYFYKCVTKKMFKK